VEAPTHDVGTYRFGGGASDDLLGEPKPTVRGGHSSRIQGIARRSSTTLGKENWAQMAKRCAGLDKYLAEYRQKPEAARNRCLSGRKAVCARIAGQPGLETMERA